MLGKTKINWSDARFAYLLVFILCFFGIFSPIAIPVAVSDSVRKSFEAVDALKPGDTILIWSDLGSSTITCVFAATDSVLYHIFTKDLNIIWFTHSADGLMLGDERFTAVTGFGKTKDYPQYGAKFVDLGFLPGGAPSVVYTALAKDIRSIAPTDRYGTSLNNIPMMKNINDGSSIKLVYQMGAGGSPFCMEAVIGSLVNVYGTKYILVGEPETIVYAANYFATAKVTGFLPGAIGGLMYETLTKLPGISARFGTASFLIVAAILIGLVASNVRRVVMPRMKQTTKEAQ